MTWKLRYRTRLLLPLALLMGTLFGFGAAHQAQAATETTIAVDGTKPGREFDGVGAISGGGGNSRLLADYPEPQRGQILDYLFKPGYGASLQLLKLEIGGDTNSTDGAEASHEHTEGTVDCGQGYEWWIAEQARQRNPAIKFAALSWGAPSWTASANRTFWSDKAIKYLMDWMGCARSKGLPIDYLGGWNERGYDAAWYKKLRSALNDNGYGSTRIVAADDNWNVANAMASDPAFNSAVDIVGAHYPCGYLGEYKSCNDGSTGLSTAQRLGKQLWASENGSEDTDFGAAAVARAVNRDYIDGRMTAFFNWPVVAALYPNLYFSNDGMAIANQPWSGAYHIGLTTWVTAHTTQFTQPGWRYVDSATGYLGGDRGNGSYVSLKSANSSDYTTVIETMDATAAQTATFTITGGLSTSAAHVWATNVKSGNSSDWFVRKPDTTSGGRFTLTLDPGYVYTVTTVSGGGKGNTVSPTPQALSLPYSDDFDSSATTTSPKYFTDMNGAFQTTACGGGRGGSCLRQVALGEPVRWTGESHNSPYTVVGESTWSNYTVSADALFEQSGTVELLGRFNQQGRNNNGFNAYHLQVTDSGDWSILKSDTKQNWTTLTSGSTARLGTNSWHRIALTVQGSQLSAQIDGRSVGGVSDSYYTYGQPGLGVGGYQNAQFDNFSVTAGGTPTARTGPIYAFVDGAPGKCLDDNAGGTQNGTHIQLWDCNGSPAQVWHWVGETLRLSGHEDKCLDVAGQGTANGTLVQLWDCNGGPNQQWVPQPNGSVKGAQSGRCLDDPGSSSANGTQLIIWDCNGGNNQKWLQP
ncbi:ricin-type beta-trefoil lectin domain protein [Streptomyces herbicida]|uniref:ricin-type beta-trefoil lectin domain protein n=1 Tax=Streptomyces herbicida TaxID=3065675 RepID=UPI00292F8B5D|nr:ricin-type beta-trefoil lectin domain protein [Streptomyces sp. NEAU-HV9]